MPFGLNSYSSLLGKVEACNLFLTEVKDLETLLLYKSYVESSTEPFAYLENTNTVRLLL